MNNEIGKITFKIIKILKLPYIDEKPIFIGDSNINHMKQKHLEDFIKYGEEIKNIIKNPTYLARNEKKNSIEFIKKYKEQNDFVLVVARLTTNDIYFVRTMYIMSNEKVEKYLKHNYFYKY